MFKAIAGRGKDHDRAVPPARSRACSRAGEAARRDGRHARDGHRARESDRGVRQDRQAEAHERGEEGGATCARAHQEGPSPHQAGQEEEVTGRTCPIHPTENENRQRDRCRVPRRAATSSLARRRLPPPPRDAEPREVLVFAWCTPDGRQIGRVPCSAYLSSSSTPSSCSLPPAPWSRMISSRISKSVCPSPRRAASSSSDTCATLSRWQR